MLTCIHHDIWQDAIIPGVVPSSISSFIFFLENTMRGSTFNPKVVLCCTRGQNVFFSVLEAESLKYFHLSFYESLGPSL
jgi:hypothetical protein